MACAEAREKRSISLDHIGFYAIRLIEHTIWQIIILHLFSPWLHHRPISPWRWVHIISIDCVTGQRSMIVAKGEFKHSIFGHFPHAMNNWTLVVTSVTCFSEDHASHHQRPDRMVTLDWVCLFGLNQHTNWSWCKAARMSVWRSGATFKSMW
jgi:hypothetical protein